MKKPHLPVSKDNIDDELATLEISVSALVQKAEQLGEDRERIEFFDKLRDLIAEKDKSGDTMAVEVLSWAYEKLSETGFSSAG